jgi:hypothetical protein
MASHYELDLPQPDSWLAFPRLQCRTPRDVPDGR